MHYGIAASICFWRERVQGAYWRSVIRMLLCPRPIRTRTHRRRSQTSYGQITSANSSVFPSQCWRRNVSDDSWCSNNKSPSELLVELSVNHSVAVFPQPKIFGQDLLIARELKKAFLDEHLMSRNESAM